MPAERARDEQAGGRAEAPRARLVPDVVRDEPPRREMVGWYDPSQLLETGLQTVLSAVFAHRADFRLIQALGAAQQPFDYSDREVLWIDYVADTGDGFAPTHAVARLAADDALRPEGLSAGEAPLSRGDVLVLGGDQVYPTASVREYQDRFAAPFAAALPAAAVGAGREAEMFAIPGNHDWYDGLMSFMKLFAQGRRIGGWRTRQNRSYFALRLPHGVWLLGVDVQLESDIDFPQLSYFRGLPIQSGERVILCSAEPHWIYGAAYGAAHGLAPDSNLAALEAWIRVERGASIVLRIAGDLHHYRRHERAGEGEEAPSHLVTAGGGGAFLHPTHTHRLGEIELGRGLDRGSHRLAAEYPDAKTSRARCRQNVAFPRFNGWFGLATACSYLILSWVMPKPTLESGTGLAGVLSLFLGGLTRLAEQPASLAWFAGLLLAFVAFTDTHKKAYRWIAGLLHGGTHAAAALGVSGIAWNLGIMPLAERMREAGGWAVECEPIVSRVLLSLGAFAGGWLVGPLIMGVYLYVSVRVFRRHGNEAFSSLRIEGWKHFVRMRIDRRGISVWAVGLDAVPPSDSYRWDSADGAGRWVPDGPLRPRVIDHFEVPHPRA